jgi:hypothetical protein
MHSHDKMVELNLNRYSRPAGGIELFQIAAKVNITAAHVKTT